MNNGDRNFQRAARRDEAATPQEQAALAAQLSLVQRHCAAGDFAAAESLCRRMLQTAPGQPQVIEMLGHALWSQGRHDDAIATLAPLVEQWPNAGSARFRLGNALQAAGRYSEAAVHLRRASELQPNLAGVHNNLGLALAQLHDREGAIRAYRRAVSLQPDLAPAHANLGAALLEAGKPGEAVDHLRRAAALPPAIANTYLLLGLALARIDQPAEALPWFERAVALEPSLAAWIGLGRTLRALGRFAEAATAFEKASAINPHLGVPRHALTTVRRQIADDAELDQLRRIMTDPAVSADERGAAGMAMAKILDDSDRYDEAFAAAQEGNRLCRAAQIAANIRYDHDAFCAHTDELMRIFTPDLFARTRGWGNPSELPVFIVGFFRTGSTLVEQICASHSQVHGIGESPAIADIAGQVQRLAPEHWTATMFRAFADRHVAQLAACAPGKQRVADKLLDNVYRLGLIATMFPHARVIVTHRDGRDAALSSFMRNFGQDIAHATDLLDAGRRWHETERMAAYWARCLPLSMHHIQYETLVADFENEARKLIDFLGLPWEPACLEFHKTERAVNTASAWQVRQPLYDSSVGRWRNYARHLKPLCAVLGIDPEAPTGTRPADVT